LGGSSACVLLTTLDIALCLFESALWGCCYCQSLSSILPRVRATMPRPCAKQVCL
jgi:hypothetical protein